MKTSQILFYSLAIATAFTACTQSKEENPTGKWVASAPQTVTSDIYGSTSANKVTTIEFQTPVDKQPGVVIYTADYDVTVPYITDSVANTKSYLVTATIKGSYVQDKHDDDEYLLSFDKNTLTVSGTNAPELGPVTNEFLNSITPLTAIEDVKVNKERTHLTFETKSPEIKFVYVAKQ